MENTVWLIKLKQECEDLHLDLIYLIFIWILVSIPFIQAVFSYLICVLYPNIIWRILLRIACASLTHSFDFIPKHHLMHSLTHSLCVLLTPECPLPPGLKPSSRYPHTRSTCIRPCRHVGCCYPLTLDHKLEGHNLFHQRTTITNSRLSFQSKMTKF